MCPRQGQEWRDLILVAVAGGEMCLFVIVVTFACFLSSQLSSWVSCLVALIADS